MDPNFIISPVMGAAIGGLANWLAIQMLFFPLKEKRVFGIRIPFTPGLIPKERKRIAQSVANTVANYFLSEDVILNAVVSPKAEEQFKQYIREVIDKQKKSSETLEVFFKKVSGKSLIKIYEENEDKILNFIEEQINSNDFIEIIIPHIEAEVDRLLEKSLLELSDEKMGEKLSEGVEKLLKSDEVNSFIGKVTAAKLQELSKSERQIGEVVPKGVIDFIKAKSVTNSDKIAEMIIDFITSSSVQFKMRKFLKNSFESSFKLRMLSKVVDVEKIFENILEELVNFLEQRDSHREIANFLIKIIESFENSKIIDISENYGLDIDEEKLKETLKQFILSISGQKNVLKSVEVSNILNLSIKDIIKYFDSSIIENRGQLIRTAARRVQTSFDIKKILGPIIKSKIEELGKIETGKVFSLLKDNDISLIEKAVVDNFKKLIRGESDRIIKIIDVSKIVEDKINAFDIGEMEEIMLGVIRKDIVVMRAFEAGIGFVIGFFIPLYPYILKLF